MNILVAGAGALGYGCVTPTMEYGGHTVALYDPYIQSLGPISLYGKSGSAACVPTATREIDTRPDLVISCTRPAPDLTTFARFGADIVPLENEILVPTLIRQGSKFKYGLADILAVNNGHGMCSEDPTSGIGRICLDESLADDIGAIPGIEYYPHDVLRLLWAARFVTHNTGHAVLAYLGARKNYTYVHEAALDLSISLIAQESMWEAGTALSQDPDFARSLGIESLTPDTHDMIMQFVRYYHNTEIDRYQKFEPDTIARVTRDPKRKLSPNERLVAPAQAYVRSTGKMPTALLLGIDAAIEYMGEDYLATLRDVCCIESGPLRDAIVEGIW